MSLSDHEKRLLKRRQAIEPLFGHTKADHKMDRCWLQGALGDALDALGCAAGYNIRWLLRAVTRLGLKGLFAPCRARLVGAVLSPLKLQACADPRLAAPSDRTTAPTAALMLAEVG